MPLSLELRTREHDDRRTLQRPQAFPIRVEPTSLTPDMLRTMLRAQLPPASTSIQFAPPPTAASSSEMYNLVTRGARTGVEPSEALLPLRNSYDAEKKAQFWNLDEVWKCGQWFLLFLAIAFVTVVVVMLGVVLHHVQSMVDEVGGDTLSDKVDTLMGHAIGAARNAEIVSADAVQMSALARNAAQEAHPKFLGALNESQQLMHDLRDFSLHPAVTLTAGRG